jgi:LacI family transcriptional regulator
MPGSRPSIRDIAARVGVSPTTVSHALNRVPGTRVSDATRVRVEQVAAELGYAPNGHARALRTHRSNTLALISEEISTTPYAGRLILGAQETAFARGYVLIVLTSGGAAEVEDREIAAIWQHQVDGVLYASTAHRFLNVPASLEGKPVFVVNGEAADGRYPSVFPDEEQGGYDATRELLDHGHRSIGLINTGEDIPARDGRRKGYRRALNDAGIPYDETLISSADGSFAEDGYIATRRLLERHQPTALFCFNDRMAMGAYRAANELRLRIPDDISIIGFDNQTIVADALHPGLTTMALPYYEMGALAVETLLADVTGDGRRSPVKHSLRSTLVRRASVAPPP